MNEASGNPIPIGVRHRTQKELSLLVYNYDQMVIKTVALPAHRLFRPWDSFGSWRGYKVPITLGDSTVEFDWGLESGEAHFLFWNDFFSGCKPVNEHAVKDVVLDMV